MTYKCFGTKEFGLNNPICKTCVFYVECREKNHSRHIDEWKLYIIKHRLENKVKIVEIKEEKIKNNSFSQSE